MIISASYKTDIPTFYGRWFMNRLEAGYCKMINPYGGQVYTVRLDRPSVSGFVFWTKNVRPFLGHLATIRERGYPFVVQYTINGYPRVLESSVVDSARSVDAARQVSRSFGPRVVVWRYDTVLITNETPFEFHEDNFSTLARGLAGATDEVVVSFAQFYRKTRRNLEEAARGAGLEWAEPTVERQRLLLDRLQRVARGHGMRLTICSQSNLVVEGTTDARCVDARRLKDADGVRIHAKLKGNRKDCGCFESRDIGEYDTCPHGCIYCYAVTNRDLALRRFREHDPDSEFLFAPAEKPTATAASLTLPLFGRGEAG